MPDMLDPDTGYSFLAEAAAEAREASRKYWAPGGPADRKWPVQPSPGWPIAGEGGNASTDARSRRARRDQHD